MSAGQQPQSGRIPVQFRNVNLPPAEQIKIIEVDPEQTVDIIRKQVQEAFNIPDTQTAELISAGHNLQGGKRFKEYNVGKKDVVTVIPRQRPGFSVRL
jgi:hypothetical protein